MRVVNQRWMSLEEYDELRETTDKRLEYMNGVVCMVPSPSTKHQRISGRMYVELFHFFEETDCEVFHAPWDVELYSNEIDEKYIVVPDLCVICDKEGLQDQKYVGVPTWIIEILSPSNQAYDLVFKLNIYMRYQVKEYWIVNPMLNSIQVYALNEQKQYDQVEVIKEKGSVRSSIFPAFSLDVAKIFS
ncbi:Uma2 family endonuclease [Anoxybacillus flavithermus]|uniref:Uma2 family endonuclease n=2 Tax=Anoxybacillaceae TaxID=3120669 RepID=UPI001D8622E9|nr:Uma2 family endonuclease [Anoxybacillus flavithermus]MBE2943900.1 Uma2 family endonuclease [Anoxybacillus flavithermus]MBE2952157.1 Uma2 family endonuclease [Anoxybacillus flavithermus]MBE2954789.1 Uma2 family endonuclease [Anoxybacillus flavithermus]MBE2960154.1 Uma2 family endonuclease [Anoxybacillus flavithermus]